jgi:pantothenate kinase
VAKKGLLQSIASALIGVVLASAFSSAALASAGTPSVRTFVVVGIYLRCGANPSSAIDVNSWYLQYPTQMNGGYYVAANTYSGVIQVFVQAKSSRYALIKPVDSFSARAFKSWKCPNPIRVTTQEAIAFGN